MTFSTRVRLFSLLVLPFIVATVSGCAIGVKHQYHNVVPDLKTTGGGTVAVAVQDSRPYVVNANKAASFVGLQRGGFGNPFDVHTESSRPLAADIADSVCESFRRKDFACNVIETQPKAAPDDVDKRTLAVEIANRVKINHVLLFILNEWKSDTFQNTALLYDVVVTVLKPDGTITATERIQGRDNLGGSAWNPPAHARQAVPLAFKGKIEQLLNASRVLESFRTQ
ncbi:MAG: hypothetical protein NZ533_11920 [Casimicrobiaceae bacterium]|nr:hypothetical protein [Casimicrobiaceae bacterium]